MYRSVYDWEGEESRRQKRRQVIIRAVLTVLSICVTVGIAILAIDV
ncbi:hypothetical protein [Phyllobacterium sp. K27]